jgi:3-phenylpropionate/cinnamic acid dioxygenase small subunit
MSGTRELREQAGAARMDHAYAASFLYEEARLLDQHDYEDWLGLWSDEGVYWIPANGDEQDPERHVSLVYDNRRRLEMRVKQLESGYRYAQLPQSRTQHYISNVQVIEDGQEQVTVHSSYLVVEARAGEINFWPGRARHHLTRTDGGGYLIDRKVVVLINNDLPVPSMAFLL